MSSRTSGRGPAFSKPRSKLRKWLPVLLLLGAAGCLTGAFFQFRVSQEVGRRAAVMLVMDASNSMNETDVEPSRLAAAQDAAQAFIANVPEDLRVGLVTFAGSATLHEAPTLDRSPIEQALGSLITSEGTAIGDGLTEALDSLEAYLRSNEDGSTAIVLLSDGRDNGSDVLPTVAAARAMSLGTKVFTVLLGEDEIDEVGVSNGELLEGIARTTHGRASNAVTASQLIGTYEELGTTLSTTLAVKDIGLPFLIGAGVLGLLAAVALVKSMDTTDWR